METVVYLVHHSEVTSKSNLKMISNKDSGQILAEKSFLSVSGEKKALMLSKIDELKNIDAVYSSNYVRALETAKYIAQENNTIIHVDDRLNERKIGNVKNIDYIDFYRNQCKDFDFKLDGGESLNQTKKRIVEAMKNILMFEAGNRVAVVSHSMALTCLLSSWCQIGKNYDGEIILSFDDETIMDGHFEAPSVVKVIFDGMNVLKIEYLNINLEE